MKSYCVKQKKMTECVPGSEQRVVTRNGRNAMTCKCAECGITKFRFVKGSAPVSASRAVTRRAPRRTAVKRAPAKRGRKKKGTGLILGSNSPFRNIPVLGAIL